MNTRNKRFSFALAEKEDNEEILEILESGVFEGQLSLQFTRRPDAIYSLKMEGDCVRIIVCRDSDNGKIAGLGAVAVRQLYVDGKIEKVGYLFGLRGRKEYLKIFALLRYGYEFLEKVCRDLKISYCLTTILEENTYAQKLLEKKRSFMPNYSPIGKYEVYFVRPARVGKAKPSSYLRSISGADVPRLIKFLNKSSQDQQFFPSLTEEDLKSNKYIGLKVDDFCVLCDKNDHILAAGALWDQREHKQYIVRGYKGFLRIMQPISSMLSFLGMPLLPSVGNFLNFKILSFWAVRGNDQKIFSRFLDEILKKMNPAQFMAVGIEQKSPYRQVLLKRSNITYKSRIYLVDWIKDNQKRPLNQNLIPYLECGML